ncbi:hypothetical protein [Nocardia nepalensis]|uniref:hypothetical protein n=1 Tax=Nocardia nepalensis TaxID=3375448 RepID=UPI003B66DD0C
MPGSAGHVPAPIDLALDHAMRSKIGPVITRDTAEQAWAMADRPFSGLDPAEIQSVRTSLARSESEGQCRMLDLHGSRAESDPVATPFATAMR